MKDPAVLFYIDKWLTSTSEMDAASRGWYLNLLLHNYDKKTLPEDIETLAVLANVRYSEFNLFKQVFEQVLKQKFEQISDGRISNPLTNDILKKREMFVEKRSNSGKLSYFLKYIKKQFANVKEIKKIEFINFIKENFNGDNLDTKNEDMIKQMFEHLFELYINVNNISFNSIKAEEFYKKELEISNNNPLYKKFTDILFGTDGDKIKCSGILQMEKQLKFEEFEKLLLKAKQKNSKLTELVYSFENGKYYNGKKSLYLSLNDWLNKR